MLLEYEITVAKIFWELQPEMVEKLGKYQAEKNLPRWKVTSIDSADVRDFYSGVEKVVVKFTLEEK